MVAWRKLEEEYPNKNKIIFINYVKNREWISSLILYNGNHEDYLDTYGRYVYWMYPEYLSPTIQNPFPLENVNTTSDK